MDQELANGEEIPVIDTRREAAHVEREFSRYHSQVGESVVWFPFDVHNSGYSGTYDEGGRAYLPGRLVPMLWVDQIEAPEQYVPEGKRPVQGLRFAALGQGDVRGRACPTGRPTVTLYLGRRADQ